MRYFNFITEDAYVQTGEYKVREFYKPGQHFLQRVPGMTAPGVEVGTALPFTALETGLHRVSFLVTNGAGTDSATVNVTVDSEVKDSRIVGADAATAVVEAVTVQLWLEAGEEVAVAFVGGTAPAVSAVTVVHTDEAPMPETFSADWAVFADGRDDLKGYNPGSYGIGIKPSSRIITVPVVKKVSLLYMMADKSTQEEKALVQFDGDLDDLKALGLIGPNGERVAFTDHEFNDKFAGEGFNRFGRVLPQGIAYSTVNELASFTGNFVGENGVAVSDVTVYFEPVYMYNQLPLFSYVYLQAGFAGKFGEWAGNYGYFMRWLGEAQSETIAPINRWGDVIHRDGYLYDTENQVLTTPQDGAFPGENGITYENAEQYNIRNWRNR